MGQLAIYANEKMEESGRKGHFMTMPCGGWLTSINALHNSK